MKSPNLNPVDMSFDLSIVVPVLNEVENLGPLVEEVMANLKSNINFELIFVDDGSQDGTPDKLRALAKKYNELRICFHPDTRGQSAALLTGISAAKSRHIATMDGDGQNDPADILRLYRQLRSGNEQEKFQMIIGHRRNRQDTLLKRISSRLANRVRSSLLHDASPDTGCGLKVFLRDWFLILPRLEICTVFCRHFLSVRGAG